MSGWGIFEIAMAIAGVSVLIGWHELGHYLLARLLSMRVIRYSVGFGPKIWGFRRSGIEYQLAAIPFGGFVQIFGMAGIEEGAYSEPDSYMMRPRWARFLVLFAGPFFNYILAAFLFFLMFLGWPGGNIRLHEVFPDSAGSEAGLLEGDEVTLVNGYKLSSYDQFIKYLQLGEPVTLTVVRSDVEQKKHASMLRLLKLLSSFPALRDDDNAYKEAVDSYKEKTAELRKDSVDDESLLPKLAKQEAILQALPEMRRAFRLEKDSLASLEAQSVKGKGVVSKHEIKVSPRKVGLGYRLGVVPRFEVDETRSVDVSTAFFGAFEQCNYKGVQQVRGMASLFVNKSMKGASGPIGIIKMLAVKVNESKRELLYMLAMLSITLAVFNVIPVPALDGFKMMWVLIEMIARREVLPKVQMWMNVLGFFLLMGSMLYVTVMNDLF
ncbi:MAG: RIP metalloprotease RseP [Deltaproteobacteria bacterium]|nr:RIP metalloprotease RseP [Deltaproteobacteria bacterium]